MKEKTRDFLKDLKSPVYTEVFSYKGTKKKKNEFSIGGDWKIVVDENSSLQVNNTTQDLRDFLRVCMAVELKLSQSITSPNILKKTILLTRNKNLIPEKIQPNSPESFGIKCDSDCIIICGYDDSGIMYGVYRLEEELKFRGAPFLKKFEMLYSPIFKDRIYRSFASPYYKDELIGDGDYCTDNYLSKLSHHGFNGIWIHGILRDLIKSKIFSEFGKNSEKRIKNLNRLIERCKSYGIGVYLYLTEPVAFPKDDPFFKKYPHIKGAVSFETPTYAMCTSTPEVKRFLEEGSKELFSKTTGLSGLILITASEHHHHCYSHVDLTGTLKEKSKPPIITCERCKKRTPQEVVSEIITLINKGAKSAKKDAKVIAWNWSWSMYEKDPQEGIIKRLPKDVILMGDFERGGKIEIEGLKTICDEYSLSYIGPSERFTGLSKCARRLGMDVYAKVQIGTTHENATIPYLPVMQKLCNKFLNLRRDDVKGLMECWNFGNFLTLSTEVANFLSWDPYPKDINEILFMFARREYGKKNASYIVKAWSHFSKATDYYPLSLKVLYFSPLNRGSAYPFFFEKLDKPMPSAGFLADKMGDRLSDWTMPYGPERVISGFEKLAHEWQKGIDLLDKAINFVPVEKKRNARKDFNIAKAMLCQVKSTINFTRFTILRNKLYEENDTERIDELLNKMVSIVKNEIENDLECKKLVAYDSRLGFHVEAQGYMYNEKLIDKKVAGLKEILHVKIPNFHR